MTNKRNQIKGFCRNVDEKKERLKKAFGYILKDKGFGNLGVNKVSLEAGISKNLIYRYFGDFKTLIEQYSEGIDYWTSQAEKRDYSEMTEKDVLKNLLGEQFNYLILNPEMRQLVLWGLHESNYNTTSLLKKRELFAERLILQKADKRFDGRIDYRGVVSVLMAAVYHLAAYSSVQKANFCGIDLSQDKGRKRVLDAINLILDNIYDLNEDKKKATNDNE
ncbi:TetR/AcrR family transcriptional regulator [Sphingobacterium deserti]|uniref:TetR family transcriptional regulator n=1 Tax=Sphingobacterium deserti TaxID=1229276 RepID=A0A0B8T935_9SPHI|nr:TetR/AcrR family transcriptional regulator [Sphingobacterium deserti]KGE14505.1 TetR family transcriptional regulator [Sphingobacterium deserti]